MPLLAYASEAQADDPRGASFLDLLSTLERTLPGTFLLPISPNPPRQTVPNPTLDWVTLPRGARRAITLGLLRRYARWYRPNVSIFAGREGHRLATACYDGFGARLLWEDDQLRHPNGTPVSLETLATQLPVSVVIDETCSKEAMHALLSARAGAPELRLYCPGVVDAGVLEKLHLAADQFASKPRVFVRLKQGLMNAEGASEAMALTPHVDRFEINICSERELGAAVAGILSATLRAVKELA